MQSYKRGICVDVCDYTGKALCNLYDSTREVSGQAHDIYTHKERNGLKELRFSLPSECIGAEGQEKNYRLDYLVNDFSLKVQTKKANSNNIETDWFLISEDKVTHNNFSKEYEVKARHISTLLNTKKLDLEFTDEGGNNVGTIGQIAAYIVEGTGWHLGNVSHFYEERKYNQNQDIEKIRSFSASTGTGAFKLMSDLCELFDAKPIYHGEGQYQSYSVTGTNPNGTNDTYGENLDTYEASVSLQRAREIGWTNLVLNDTGIKIGRTVDIVPLNPFSCELNEGSIPEEVLNGAPVLELHYDKNMTQISRTLNSDNMVTKLSAYGSYGDRNGMCSLQKAKHEVVHFKNVPKNKEYKFTYADTDYYFTVPDSDEYTEFDYDWSTLDPTSRMYVVNKSTLTIDFEILELYKEPKTNNYETITYTVTEEYNYFPYVTDYTYYRKNGLLTDEGLYNVAKFQTEMPQKYIEAEEASYALSEAKANLLKTVSADNGFLKLDIQTGIVESSTSNINYGQLVLTLDKSEYPDGVIYRSDYDEAKRNRFSWKAATGIKNNGEAIAGIGSVVYIIRQGNPTTWTKSYVKMIGDGTNNFFTDEMGNYYTLHTRSAYATRNSFPNSGTSDIVYVAEDTGKMYVWNSEYIEIKASNYNYGGVQGFNEPSTITLWCADNSAWTSGDIVYLFSADSIAGLFGPREDAIFSNRESIEKTTEVATERHPLYFVADSEIAPSADSALMNYGWYYRSYTNTFDFGELYFCWGKNGDLGWTQVYVSFGTENPEVNPVITPNLTYGYYYSIKNKMLYTPDSTNWKPINKESVDEKNIKAAFASVIAGCINQEILTKGVSEVYTYTQSSGTLSKGNYAFRNEFGNYWLFTTDLDLQTNGELNYHTDTKMLWQDTDEHHVLKAKEYSFDILTFPAPNELFGITVANGKYDSVNHTFSTDGDMWISNTIHAYENVQYECNLPTGYKVVFTDNQSRYTGEATSSPFTTANHTTGMRIVCPSTSPITSSHWIRVAGYSDSFFVEDKKYTVLSCTPSGERLGIYYLMDQFISLSDYAYLDMLMALKGAQDAITKQDALLASILGDMYREGWWQQNDYVEGDEDKLYSDSLDNIVEISHPEATYEINFLDLYGSQKNVGLSVDEESEEIDYPDIDIDHAVHLVDADIDTNRWAYIDSMDKYHDLEWKTMIEINTRLSTIGQQSFTDVLSRIAEVSNETRAKQTLYKRAASLSDGGTLAGERLEGTLSANKVYLAGGTSNWYTDPKGNIIFEAADGESAMMLTGRGLMVSQDKDIFGDWSWRTAITGKGMSADAIYTGYLSAERIEAGTITADKLSASVGNELEIGSNKALTLFATTDGYRPAGSLETAHPSQGDSWIDIRAQDGNDPAYIAVKSGGNIDIESGGALNMTGANMNLTSQGRLNVDGGVVDIKAGSEFLVNSPNFSIVKNQNNDYEVTVDGTIIAKSGEIAGFTIGEHKTGNVVDYRYMASPNNHTLNSTNPGLYIGTNGMNLGGKFIYDEANNTLTAIANSITMKDSSNNTFFNMSNGNISMNATLNDDSSISINSNKKLSLTTAGIIEIGSSSSGAKLFEIGATSTDAYITNGKTSYSDTSNNGVYVGTDGISLGKINIGGTNYNAFTVDNQGALTARNATITGSVTANDGSIGGWTIGQTSLYSGTSANSVYLDSGTANENYAIWAGAVSSSDAPFKVARTGAVSASNISITGGSIQITNNNVTTFQVTSAGALTAISGQVGGWYISDEHMGDANTYASSAVGMANKTGTDVVFWAGNSTKTSANFYVRADGYLKSKSGTVGGWSIGTTTLTGNKVGLCVTTNDSDIAIYSGKPWADRTTAPFRVTQGGSLYASSATITGSVTATSGSIGAWSISDSSLRGTYTATGISSTIRLNPSLDNCLRIESTQDRSMGSFSWTETYVANIKADGSCRFQNDSKIGDFYFNRFDYSNVSSVTQFDQVIQGTVFGTRAKLNSNNTYYYCEMFSLHPEDSADSPVLAFGTGNTNIGNRKFKVCANGKVVASNSDNDFTGTFHSTSSINVKHNINNITFNNEIIDKLNPVSFVYNNDKTEHKRFGLIYEDTIKILPEICDDKNDNKTINYIDLVPVLLKEIQNLRQRLNKLERN